MKLQSASFDAVITGDPWDALGLMELEGPHLALLDLVLPGADGPELMQDIHQVVDLPVIFLSGYGQDQVIARVFQLGLKTTSSSPSRPRSWWRESRRPCGGGQRRNGWSRRSPSCWGTCTSTKPIGGLRWPGRRCG